MGAGPRAPRSRHRRGPGRGAAILTPEFAVELEHRIAAAPETVFSYFTDPDKYRRWKGTEAELDPRPGGIYRVAFGPDVWVRGEYVVVDPPRLLTVTWGFEGHIDLPRGLGQVPPGSSTVEFRFVPDGDDTIVRVRHVGLPTKQAHDAHHFGWVTYLPRLATAIDGVDPGPDPTREFAEALLALDPEAMTTEE